MVFDVLERENIEALPPVVSRLDLTTDVGFLADVDAQRVLAALSAVTIPGFKLVTYRGRGSSRIESVAWQSAKRIRLRVYDSLAKDESRAVTGFAGLVRFEHQYAPEKRRQLDVATIKTMDLASLSVAPLGTPEAGSRIVGDLAAMNTLLKQMGGDGKSDVVAERRLGTLVRAYLEGRDAWPSRRVARERMAELRQLGLSLSPELPDPVDLGPVLSAVKSAWAGDRPASPSLQEPE